MKNYLSYIFLMLVLGMLCNVSCKKEDMPGNSSKNINEDHGHLKQTKTFSSGVLRDWISLDLQLLRDNPTRLNNFVMLHHWSYSSIALYESMIPGMPANQSLFGQLNEMPSIPKTEPGKPYHWPSVANTVLAAMMRNFYKDSVTSTSLTAISELETNLNKNYLKEIDQNTFERSRNFGNKISEIVYRWALSDGYITKHSPYMIPTGPGMWERTSPSFLAPQRPFWGSNRPLMPESIIASQLPPPPVFSTETSSAFYQSAKEVYSLSQNLTSDDREQILFWRDVPGGGHAHWLSIFLQVLNKEDKNLPLNKAALIYAKLGITQNDARISCWKAKYQYNLIRPVSYINDAISIGWNSFINTPNHPEYPSAHSSFSEPAAYVLTKEFGNNYAFTDNSYNFLSLPERSYGSFQHAADEAGGSRILGGLHYRFSVSAGKTLGAAIARYMYENVRFEK